MSDCLRRREQTFFVAPSCPSTSSSLPSSLPQTSLTALLVPTSDFGRRKAGCLHYSPGRVRRPLQCRYRYCSFHYSHVVTLDSKTPTPANTGHRERGGSSCFLVLSRLKATGKPLDSAPSRPRRRLVSAAPVVRLQNSLSFLSSRLVAPSRQTVDEAGAEPVSTDAQAR